MQVHGPSVVIKDEHMATEVHAYLNGTFAVLNLGPVTVHVHTAAEADALIAAAVKVKQLIDPPVITDSERTCPAMNDGWHCHRNGEHAVHEDDNGDLWRTDEAAPSAAPNPPHHALRTSEPECQAADYMNNGYVCTSQDGHDGPDHVAWMPGGGEYHRWPMAAPSAAQDTELAEAAR